MRSLLRVVTCDCFLPRQHSKASTYFVDHVSKQALDLIRVNLLLAAQANGSRELGNGNSCTPGGRIYVWRHSARKEDLSQQVPETGVMGSLKREIDPAFDKFILTLLQCLIEGVQVALLDALG